MASTASGSSCSEPSADQEIDRFKLLVLELYSINTEEEIVEELRLSGCHISSQALRRRLKAWGIENHKQWHRYMEFILQDSKHRQHHIRPETTYQVCGDTVTVADAFDYFVQNNTQIDFERRPRPNTPDGIVVSHPLLRSELRSAVSEDVLLKEFMVAIHDWYESFMAEDVYIGGVWLLLVPVNALSKHAVQSTVQRRTSDEQHHGLLRPATALSVILLRLHLGDTARAAAQQVCKHIPPSVHEKWTLQFHFGLLKHDFDGTYPLYLIIRALALTSKTAAILAARICDELHQVLRAKLASIRKLCQWPDSSAGTAESSELGTALYWLHASKATPFFECDITKNPRRPRDECFAFEDNSTELPDRDMLAYILDGVLEAGDFHTAVKGEDVWLACFINKLASTREAVLEACVEEQSSQS